MVVDLAGWRLGLMTCYDLRFPELARALVDAGAEVLVVPAAWVAGPRKVDHWRTLVRARAIENTVYVVAAAQPAPRYAGHSMVVDPLGDVLAEAGDGGRDDPGHADPDGSGRGPPDEPVAGQPPDVVLGATGRSVTLPAVPRTAPRRRAGRRDRGRAPAGRRRRLRSEAETVLAPPVIDRAGRRARAGAEPTGRVAGGPGAAEPEVVPGPTTARRGRVDAPGPAALTSRTAGSWSRLWVAVVLAGLGCLVAALVPVGPSYLDGVGAVAVVTAYAWALAARTGGRPVVFGGLALVARAWRCW